MTTFSISPSVSETVGIKMISAARQWVYSYATTQRQLFTDFLKNCPINLQKFRPSTSDSTQIFTFYGTIFMANSENSTMRCCLKKKFLIHMNVYEYRFFNLTQRNVKTRSFLCLNIHLLLTVVTIYDNIMKK